MATRRTRKNAALALQAAELAVAAPQVVAHRVARMALAGPVLSARDRKEFHRMGAEKTVAFGAAWNAMAVEAVRANQALALSFFRAAWLPSPRKASSAAALAAQMQGAALGVLGKGMAPVRRKAVANAKRLATTRLR